MICEFTKEYILEKTEKKYIEFPKNYNDILESYCVLVKKYGYKLEFKKGRNLPFDSLGANAGIFHNNSIVATPEWAFRLVTTDDASVPFMITLGHELAHKEKEFPRFRHLINIKFCDWVDEVHADYRATERMFNNNRDLLLNAIDYKLKYKRDYQKGDIEDFIHPSWARRKYYVKHFDFDAKLIQQIAKDVGCKNHKLINKVCKFYKPIRLN